MLKYKQGGVMRFLVLSIIFSISFLTSCSRIDRNVGSISNPFIIGLSKPYFEKLTEEDIKSFETKLKEKSDLEVRIDKFDNPVNLIKAFGSKRIDMAFITINEYLIAREEYGVIPVLKIRRKDNQTEYYSVIVTVDKNIKNLKDVDGKKFASRSVYSISSFVLPSILFLKGGINPQYIFTDSFDESYKFLKERKADVAAFYKNFVNDHKDLNVIYEIGPIPNEPIVCRKTLDIKFCEKIKDALLKVSNEDKTILNKMADIDGFVEVNLKEYKEIHDILKSYSRGIYSLVPDGIEIKKLNEEYSFN